MFRKINSKYAEVRIRLLMITRLENTTKNSHMRKNKEETLTCYDDRKPDCRLHIIVSPHEPLNNIIKK